MKSWLAILSGFLILTTAVMVLLPFWNSLAWAAVIVITTWPVHLRLRERFLFSHSWSAFAMTTGLLALFLLIVYPLVRELGEELRGLSQISLTDFERGLVSLNLQIAQLPYVGMHLSESLHDLRRHAGTLTSLFDNYQGEMLRAAASFTKGIFEAVISTVATFFFMFFFFRDGDGIGKQLVAAAHRIGGDKVIELLSISRMTVRAALYGYLLTAAAQGTLASIGYFFAGVPLPLLFGGVTALVSLVPFGTPFVYVPLIAYLTWQGSSPLTIVLLSIWCVGFVSMADNIIRPMVISQVTSLSLLLVLLGVLGGIIQFGLIGLVIGPLSLALLQAMWISFVTKGLQQTAASPR